MSRRAVLPTTFLKAPAPYDLPYEALSRRLARSLSTLRGRGLPRPRKTCFRLCGSRLGRAGFDPQGFFMRFLPSTQLMASSSSELGLAHQGGAEAQRDLCASCTLSGSDNCDDFGF